MTEPTLNDLKNMIANFESGEKRTWQTEMAAIRNEIGSFNWDKNKFEKYLDGLFKQFEEKTDAKVASASYKVGWIVSEYQNVPENLEKLNQDVTALKIAVSEIKESIDEMKRQKEEEESLDEDEIEGASDYEPKKKWWHI